MRFDLADILTAYAHGYFPMAESADAPGFHWYDPEMRGILPIETLHVPRKLEKWARRMPFDIAVDQDFEDVIRACAAPVSDRPQTWINEDIIAIFTALYHAGYAHCVACRRDGALVGGIYGLALGGLFCGESMFSRTSGGSKIALLHLCARLWKGGFTVLDTQFINPHLLQFGAYEIPRDAYEKLRRAALRVPATFDGGGNSSSEKYLLNQFLDNR